MKYLMSKFPCTIVGEKYIHLEDNVRYEIKNLDDEYNLVFGDNGELTKCVNLKNDFSQSSEYILKFNYKNDTFIILYPQLLQASTLDMIKALGKNYIISLSNTLNISVEGENILDCNVQKITYSHYEVRGDYIIFYFKGIRNYVVIVKDKEICCADYYDEINVSENEIYFMSRLFDSINHGRVYLIKDKKFDTYLIYLDEEDMNLKNEFVVCVFLDALLAKNFNYCNAMLSQDIRQTEAKDIIDFFPKFDDYFPINSQAVALIEKNTLAGIFEFQTINDKIENIITIS